MKVIKKTYILNLLFYLLSLLIFSSNLYGSNDSTKSNFDLINPTNGQCQNSISSLNSDQVPSTLMSLSAETRALDDGKDTFFNALVSLGALNNQNNLLNTTPFSIKLPKLSETILLDPNSDSTIKNTLISLYLYQIITEPVYFEALFEMDPVNDVDENTSPLFDSAVSSNTDESADTLIGIDDLYINVRVQRTFYGSLFSNLSSLASGSNFSLDGPEILIELPKFINLSIFAKVIFGEDVASVGTKAVFNNLGFYLNFLLQDQNYIYELDSSSLRVDGAQWDLRNLSGDVNTLIRANTELGFDITELLEAQKMSLNRSITKLILPFNSNIQSGLIDTSPFSVLFAKGLKTSALGWPALDGISLGISDGEDRANNSVITIEKRIEKLVNLLKGQNISEIESNTSFLRLTEDTDDTFLNRFFVEYIIELEKQLEIYLSIKYSLISNLHSEFLIHESYYSNLFSLPKTSGQELDFLDTKINDVVIPEYFEYLILHKVFKDLFLSLNKVVSLGKESGKGDADLTNKLEAEPAASNIEKQREILENYAPTLISAINRELPVLPDNSLSLQVSDLEKTDNSLIIDIVSDYFLNDYLIPTLDKYFQSGVSSNVNILAHNILNAPIAEMPIFDGSEDLTVLKSSFLNALHRSHFELMRGGVLSTIFNNSRRESNNHEVVFYQLMTGFTQEYFTLLWNQYRFNDIFEFHRLANVEVSNYLKQNLVLKPEYIGLKPLQLRSLIIQDLFKFMHETIVNIQQSGLSGNRITPESPSFGAPTGN